MNQSRTQNSARNAIWTLLARVVTLILGFVSRMIFLRFLTTEYLGINGLFSNILTMLSLAELGVGNAIQFSLYKPVKEGNTEKIKSLMRIYQSAYRWIAVFVVVAGVAILPFLDFIIENKPDIPENINIIYLLFIANSAVSYLFSYKQTLLHADQNSYIVTICNSITAIGQNIVHLVVLFLTRNFMVYLISTIACTFLNNVFIAIYVNKKYTYLQEKNVEPLKKEEKKTIFRDIKSLSISKIAGVACNGTDNIIITKLVGLNSVGLASNYTLIINTMSNMIYAMLSSMTGSVGNLNADSDVKQRKSIFDQMFLMSYLVYGCISTCIIVLVNQFVGEVWLGKEFLVSYATIIALMLIGFQSGMNFTAYTFRTTLGYFDEVKYVYVLTAVLNIGLSIAFGIWFGLAGVYFATVISKLLTSEIADGYYSYKKGLNMNPLWYFVKYIGYFLLLVANTAFCFFVINLIPLHGIWGFLVRGVACFILCNAINILVFFRTKAFKSLSTKFGVIFKKRLGRKN